MRISVAELNRLLEPELLRGLPFPRSSHETGFVSSPLWQQGRAPAGARLCHGLQKQLREGRLPASRIGHRDKKSGVAAGDIRGCGPDWRGRRLQLGSGLGLSPDLFLSPRKRC